MNNDYEQTFEALVLQMEAARKKYDAALPQYKQAFVSEMTLLKEKLLALTRSKTGRPTTSTAIPLYPDNEAIRVKTLKDLEVINTPFEPLFDSIVDLAACICDAPIALIVLIDEDTQWFKAAKGIEGIVCTPRDMGICAHTILSTELLEIPDASDDERFYDNPFVTGGPQIRFYAGAPLVMRGDLSLGTLCVINSKPSYLTSHQKEALVKLSQVAVNALVARKAHLNSLN